MDDTPDFSQMTLLDLNSNTKALTECYTKYFANRSLDVLPYLDGKLSKLAGEEAVDILIHKVYIPFTPLQSLTNETSCLLYLSWSINKALLDLQSRIDLSKYDIKIYHSKDMLFLSDPVNRAAYMYRVIAKRK